MFGNLHLSDVDELQEFVVHICPPREADDVLSVTAKLRDEKVMVLSPDLGPLPDILDKTGESKENKSTFTEVPCNGPSTRVRTSEWSSSGAVVQPIDVALLQVVVPQSFWPTRTVGVYSYNP
jgi:hypothetical protein